MKMMSSATPHVASILVHSNKIAVAPDKVIKKPTYTGRYTA
jgi:hypothetical protein